MQGIVVSIWSKGDEGAHLHATSSEPAPTSRISAFASMSTEDIRGHLSHAENQLIDSFGRGVESLETFSQHWDALHEQVRQRTDDDSLASLAHSVAGRISVLASSFSELRLEEDVLTASLLTEVETILVDNVNEAPPSCSSANVMPRERRTKVHEQLRASASSGESPVVHLQFWIKQNLHNPYPSSLSRQSLSQKTGSSVRAVNNWFTNARRKIGWTSIRKNIFSGDRLATAHSAYRVFVEEDPSRPVSPRIKQRFLRMKDEVDRFMCVDGVSALALDVAMLLERTSAPRRNAALSICERRQVQFRQCTVIPPVVDGSRKNVTVTDPKTSQDTPSCRSYSTPKTRTLKRSYTSSNEGSSDDIDDHRGRGRLMRLKKRKAQGGLDISYPPCDPGEESSERNYVQDEHEGWNMTDGSSESLCSSWPEEVNQPTPNLVVEEGTPRGLPLLTAPATSSTGVQCRKRPRNIDGGEPYCERTCGTHEVKRVRREQSSQLSLSSLYSTGASSDSGLSTPEPSTPPEHRQGLMMPYDIVDNECCSTYHEDATLQDWPSSLFVELLPEVYDSGKYHPGLDVYPDATPVESTATFDFPLSVSEIPPDTLETLLSGFDFSIPEGTQFGSDLTGDLEFSTVDYSLMLNQPVSELNAILNTDDYSGAHNAFPQTGGALFDDFLGGQHQAHTPTSLTIAPQAFFATPTSS